MEKLPQGVLCLAVSHSLDDMAVIESYLADPVLAPMVEKCIPIALRDILSPYAEAAGLPHIKIPSARDTHSYLGVLWLSRPRNTFRTAFMLNVPSIIPYLLSTHPDQEEINDALSLAAKKGLLDIVRVLIGAGAKAARRGILRNVRNTEIATALVSAGAIPQPGDLANAALEGDLEMVKFLTTPGRLDIHYNGDVILDYGIRSGNRKLIDYLAKRGIVGTPTQRLISASATDQTDLMQEYVLQGANVNGMHGHAMHSAILANANNAVRYLIDNGFDVKRRNYLLDAAEEGNILAMKMLIQAGADPRKNNNDAFNVAVAAGRPEAVSVLLSAGVPIEDMASVALPTLTIRIETLKHQSGRYRNYRNVLAVLLRAGAGRIAPDELKSLLTKDKYGELADLVKHSEIDPHFSEFVDSLLEKVRVSHQEDLAEIESTRKRRATRE